MRGCSPIACHSLSDRVEGLSRISSGMAILPRSWRREAILMRSISSAGKLISSARPVASEAIMSDGRPR